MNKYTVPYIIILSLFIFNSSYGQTISKFGKKEVKIEYGITRNVNTASFIDMYFGECICLVRDLKNTPGWRNKLKLLFNPPGWEPGNNEHTAKVVRSKFLKGREHLAKTSRSYLFEKNKFVIQKPVEVRVPKK